MNYKRLRYDVTALMAHMPKTLKIGIVGCLIVLIGGGLGYFAQHATPQSRPKIQKIIYVWQESWSAAVTRAALRAAPLSDGLMVFAAEIRMEDGRLTAIPKRVDWPGLAQIASPVTIVVRVEDQVAGLLTQNGVAETASLLMEQVNRLTTAAQNAKAKVAGVQLDFDCPSARLDTYRLLLERLKPSLAGREFSITALADWLNRRNFTQLVQGLSYFVLQVHSLETPKTIHDEIQLCDTGKLPGRMAQASSAGVPYYVALPTYGYRFFYDAQGNYVGFAAEGAEQAYRRGMKVRQVLADPDKMASVVRDLQHRPPENYRGIAWFRLPVETDRLNWPWPTFQAVIAGRAPVMAIEANLRNPKPALYEIWVENTGERAIDESIRLKADLSNIPLLARDGVAGFHWARTGPELSGPAPKPGESRMVAWFRVLPKAQNQEQLLNSIKIEVIR